MIKIYPVNYNIKTKEIYKSSKLVSNLTGITVQPNKAIVGINAFAHESGIHQDGMLKDKRTYEIMSPQDVGVPESLLVLGKHSGRHAFFKRLKDLGYSKLQPEVMEQLFEKFKLLADKKKCVFDDDINSLVEQSVSGVKEVYTIDYVNVTSGPVSRRAHSPSGGCGLRSSYGRHCGRCDPCRCAW